MDTEISLLIIVFLVFGSLCLLVTIAYIVGIVKFVKKVKQRAEEKRIAQIEEARRRNEEAEYRKKAEAERRKIEEERKKVEEKAKQEEYEYRVKVEAERRKAEAESKKAKKEEEARQVKQWSENYKKSYYAQNLAKIFARDFIDAISCITYDVHNKNVKVDIERNAYYTIICEPSSPKHFRKPVIDGLDFHKENLKAFDNEFQLQGFMEAMLEIAEEIVKREYVAKHPVDVNGEKYTIWKATGYPFREWDNCDGEWNEQDRKDGFGRWHYTYSVSLLYSAPNPYYEPPKNLI